MTKSSLPKIAKARKLLTYTRRRLKKLLAIPLDSRGHRDNEDIVKLRIQQTHLAQAIEKLSKKTRPRKRKVEAASLG